MKKFLTAFIVLILLAGCASKEIKPYEVYSISDNTKTKQAFHVDKILKISKIKASKQMLSDKIWYKESPIKIDSYYYSKWNDSFANIVEINLLNTISRSELFSAAYARHSKVRANFVLESELIRAVHNIKSNSVNFVFRAYLVNGKKLVGSKEFAYSEKCNSLDAKGAVEAYAKIIKKLDKEVVLWLSKLMKKD